MGNGTFFSPVGSCIRVSTVPIAVKIKVVVEVGFGPDREQGRSGFFKKHHIDR